jgi:hypothetical protein
MNEVALAFLPAGRQVLPTISFIVPNKWGRYKYKNFDSAFCIPQSGWTLKILFIIRGSFGGCIDS